MSYSNTNAAGMHTKGASPVEIAVCKIMLEVPQREVQAAYYLLESSYVDGTIQTATYGAKISMDCCGQVYEASVKDIATDREAVIGLINKLIEHKVMPVSLPDVVIDWIS